MVGSLQEIEREIQRAVEHAIQSVQSTGADGQREFVIQFENDLAQYCDSSFAVATRSAKLAALAACAAIHIEPGDEIVVSAFVGSAVATSLAMTDATIRVVDCDENGSISLTSLSRALSDSTVAVVVTHQFGIPTDILPIAELCRDRGVTIIEEVGSCFGGKLSGQLVGSFGDLSICSFQPSDSLAALSDGGALLTQSGELAELARKFVSDYARDHPLSLGTNDQRLAPTQGAVLSARLGFHDEVRSVRQSFAAKYDENLSPTIFGRPQHSELAELSFSSYIVKVEGRDSLVNLLAGEQLFFETELAVPVNYRHPDVPFQITEVLDHANYLADVCVGLPISRGANENEIARVIEVCQRFSNADRLKDAL